MLLVVLVVRRGLVVVLEGLLVLRYFVEMSVLVLQFYFFSLFLKSSYCFR